MKQQKDKLNWDLATFLKKHIKLPEFDVCATYVTPILCLTKAFTKSQKNYRK